jgi:uncharacterized protein
MTRHQPARFRRSARTARSGQFWLALLLAFGLALSALAAELAFPILSGRIVDGAGVISPEARARIEAKTGAHEAKTSDQVVIATVRSLQDTSVEDFANRLYRHWALGPKDKNNGVLLLVAPTERKVRIEVGYGLEGALTDALSKIIITTAIAPRFKTGDFGGGLEAGVDAILNILTGDAEEWQRRAKVRTDEGPTVMDYLVFGFFLLVLIIIVINIFRGGGGTGGRMHRTRNGSWITIPAGSGSWGGSSGGFSSGGWSGGGGGFSGGGGSSGGGGASGDW